MRRRSHLYNLFVTAVFCGIPLLGTAQENRADELLSRLADPELRNAQVVEQELYLVWSRSGSASADYLLRQGRAAMEAEDFDLAYNHLTALTDHAPEFAEGWNARATLFFQQQMYGPAIADIQQALALEPRHFGALMGLGFMLEDMGEIDLAMEAFQTAAEINPHREEITQAILRLEQGSAGQTL